MTRETFPGYIWMDRKARRPWAGKELTERLRRALTPKAAENRGRLALGGDGR
jgi:hypothetical protein